MGAMSATSQRLGAAIKSAVLQGQTTWSTQALAARDPRFAEVWKATRQIPGWFDEVNAVAQFVILAELRPSTIVEIGSYMGRSTVFFAKTLQVLGIDGTVVAIDPHTGDRQHLEGLGTTSLPSFDMFRAHLSASSVADLVTPIVAPSHRAAAEWDGPIDYLFIDGWHSYDAVVEDAHDWIPHLSEQGIVVFDDAVRYPDVRQAIDDLVAEGTVTLYGDAFGQAFGGRRAAAPASVRAVLASYRPLTKYLPGHHAVR